MRIIKLATILFIIVVKLYSSENDVVYNIPIINNYKYISHDINYTPESGYDFYVLKYMSIVDMQIKNYIYYLYKNEIIEMTYGFDMDAMKILINMIIKNNDIVLWRDKLSRLFFNSFGHEIKSYYINRNDDITNIKIILKRYGSLSIIEINILIDDEINFTLSNM